MQAWLGFYNSNLKTLRWNPSELVRQANLFATEVLGEYKHFRPRLLQ